MSVSPVDGGSARRRIFLVRPPFFPQAGSTFPVVPSTVTRIPVRNLAVASPQPTTAGIPYSRAMIEACAAALPTSVTTATALVNSGVHAGAVNGATRTSPGRSSSNCCGPRMTRTRPLARPGDAGQPETSARSDRLAPKMRG